MLSCRIYILFWGDMLRQSAAPLLRAALGMKPRKYKWRLLREFDHSVSGSANNPRLLRTQRLYPS